jgi:hypothetical protein
MSLELWLGYTGNSANGILSFYQCSLARVIYCETRLASPPAEVAERQTR